MKEEWEVSILLALFLLFCGDNSPQRRGHRVIMNNHFISLHRFNLRVLLSSVVKMRTKALNNEKDNSVSSMPYCKC